MKKTLLTIMATVAIMSTLFGAYLVKVTNEHNVELAETVNNYKDKIRSIENVSVRLGDDNARLQSDYYELEEQVYNMLNGEDYEVKLHINDETHIYKGDNDGLFGNKSHSVVKVDVQ